MPALLDKSAPPSALPSELLRSRHRWERLRGVLLALLVGSVATLIALWAFHLHTPGNWKLLPGIWAGGFVLTLIGAAVAWRFAPASLLDTAQEMDRHLHTKNRLEAAAALHHSESPLAHAQREETTAFLSTEPCVRPVRALPWLIAGVAIFLVAHLATLAIWVVPLWLHPAVRATPPPPRELPKALPTASIVWKSPEPETKANPIEEVPAVASVQSTSGLRNMTLEISVNGISKKSLPLPAHPFDKAGKNTLKASIYLDELESEPFDVVSYFIRGERIADGKVFPDTTSAIQFIQVRPFREDVTQVRGGSALNKNYDLLIRLKLAQLRSVKENFILAHTELPVTNPVRIKENNRVGQNEGDLSAKTEEVVQAFIQAGYSAAMIDLLRQAEPRMDDASKKILATQNNEALPPQEKALNLIVEVEKFFHKIMAEGGSAPPGDDPDDPFKSKQKHELTKRMEAAAGQLEQLARNQAKLSRDLGHEDSPGNSDMSASAASQPGAAPASSGTNADGSQKVVPLPPSQAVDPFGPDAGKGTFVERQTRVVQGIDTLLNTNSVLPPAVIQALQDAQKDAGESMHQLDQASEANAREPAAKAAQELQRAVQEMNQAGEQETKLAMENAQQKLNDLARQLRNLVQNKLPDAEKQLADLARQVGDVRRQLEDAADKQQEAGSAQGAQELEKLARQIADQKVQNDLSGMSKAGLDADKALADAQKLEALAGQAAQGQTTPNPSAQDIARLVNDLERSRANLARLAGKAGAPGVDPGANAAPSPGMSGQSGKAPGNSGEQPGGKSPAGQKGQGAGKEQGQGQGQGTQPGQQGQGQAPGQAPGEGQGEGQAPGSGGAGPASPTDPHAVGTAPNTAAPPLVAQAYREVIADLKDEAQRTAAALPASNAGALLGLLDRAEQDTRYRQTTATNIVNGYQTIAAPLDKLISDLAEAAAHAQRDEIVKEPDLDTAPPAYRSAVSDYFESMSRDYHPDSGDQDARKP